METNKCFPGSVILDRLSKHSVNATWDVDATARGIAWTRGNISTFVPRAEVLVERSRQHFPGFQVPFNLVRAPLSKPSVVVAKSLC